VTVKLADSESHSEHANVNFCSSYLLTADNHLLTYLLTNPLHDVTTKAAPEVGMGLFTFDKKVITTCFKCI